MKAADPSFDPTRLPFVLEAPYWSDIGNLSVSILDQYDFHTDWKYLGLPGKKHSCKNRTWAIVMCQSNFREILDQAQGQAVHDYMATHQDRSRNALAKSVQAAFNSWCEDLKADQAQFVSEKLLWPGSGRCAGSYPSSTKRQLTVIKLQFFFSDQQWSSFINDFFRN